MKKKQKAQQIKAILSDIDGVWTNGAIIYDQNGIESKIFNVKDGFGVVQARKMGLLVGIITGRNSEVVQKRANELQLDYCVQGAVESKLEAYENFKKQFELQDEQIAYIGDDLNDLVILSRCGLSACPADARFYIREKVDIVCKHKGGKGAFRDFIDYILDSQGLLEKLIAQNSL